jgi:hypothetical protein
MTSQTLLEQLPDARGILRINNFETGSNKESMTVKQEPKDRWDILFKYKVKQHTGGANGICCGTGLNLCPGKPVPGWLEDKSNGE